MLLCKTHFSANSGNLTLRHDVESNHIRQTAAFHVLHDNPEISFYKKAIHEIDNILMLAILHDQDFVDDEILLWLLLEVHLFDSHTLVGAHLVCCKNATRSTLADFVEVLVSQGGISVCANGIKLGNDIGSLALTGSLSGSWCWSYTSLL